MLFCNGSLQKITKLSQTMAIPCEMLLYPELLSNEQLITILQERHLRIENIIRMDRCDLIELFKNYCVPYGQRKYRDSGRGKVLNKTRRSPDPPAKLNIINHNRVRKMSVDCSERLKPPPDLLSGHMKRIKLENNIHTDDINCKRKMSIDSTTTDSPPAKKDKKLITWP